MAKELATPVNFDQLEAELRHYDNPSEEDIEDFEESSEYQEFLSTGSKDYFKSSKYAGTSFLYTDEVDQWYPTLSPEEVAELVKKRDSVLKGSDEFNQYRNDIVCGNLKLVVSWAYRYTRDHTIAPDYIQAGNIGLIIAAEKYDLEKKCRFSTYASWWIRQAILRFIALDHNMHVPVHIADKGHKVNRFVNNFLQEHGREPMQHEISQALDIPEDILLMIRTAMTYTSLDAPIDKDETGDTLLGDFVASDENVEETALKNILHDILHKEMKKVLNERELLVVMLRFGFDGEEHTLEDVGERLDVTRERVRQIQKKAIGKLLINPTLQKLFTDYISQKPVVSQRHHSA